MINTIPIVVMIARAVENAGSISQTLSVAGRSQRLFKTRGSMLHGEPPSKVVQISGFSVGAVAVGQSGGYYLGGNVEFRYHGLEHVIHAEEFAITNAINHGERSLVHLAVSMAPCGCEELAIHRKLVLSSRSLSHSPMADCRQIISELAGGSELSIWISPSTSPTSINALLPSAFAPKDLGGKGRLLSEQAHNLVLEQEPDGAWKSLAEVALAHANRSYAPYTCSPSGVALLLSCGKVMGGGYAENCAFNPSAAIVAVLSSRQSLGEVEKLVSDEISLLLCSKLIPSGNICQADCEQVLVEMNDSPVSHESSVRSLSKILFPRAEVKLSRSLSCLQVDMHAVPVPQDRCTRR
eukprot:768356-Hanusia_phi.AAC.2